MLNLFQPIILTYLFQHFNKRCNHLKEELIHPIAVVKQQILSTKNLGQKPKITYNLFGDTKDHYFLKNVRMSALAKADIVHFSKCFFIIIICFY